MLKCSNIPKYQNISQWVKYYNVPISKYVPGTKIYPSGQNVLKSPNCALLTELETSMKGIYFIFDCVNLVQYICHKISVNVKSHLTLFVILLTSAAIFKASNTRALFNTNLESSNKVLQQ